MKIIVSPRAEKGLKRLSKIDQIAVARKIRQLKESQIVQEEKLKGFPNIFRVRVGGFRIVYRKTQMTHPVVSTRSLKLSEWVIEKEIEKLRPCLSLAT